MRLNIADQIVRIASQPIVPRGPRLRLLARNGHQFAEGARIEHGTIVVGSRLRLGTECYVNTQCLIDTTDEVAIGDGTHLASRVQIVTATHEIGGPTMRSGVKRSKPVRIGAGCWIGAGVLILPGVTIGKGTVVAAGAVVAGDLPAHTLAGGVPAKVIRPIDREGEHAESVH